MECEHNYFPVLFQSYFSVITVLFQFYSSLFAFVLESMLLIGNVTLKLFGPSVSPHARLIFSVVSTGEGKTKVSEARTTVYKRQAEEGLNYWL